MNKPTKLMGAILVLSAFNAGAQQVDVSADLRFRYENRHGYGTLFSDTLKAANFITQRSRINIDYTSPRLKLRVSPQNVRTWGDVATNAKNDINTQLHETWAEVMISQTWSLKAGRQELNYDDARILGNVDWTMQARSHDVLVAKFTPVAAHTFHLGVAYNANRESNTQENYAVPQQYRAMQYLWYHGQQKEWSWSVLALNQGMPFIDQGKEKIAWNQTFGPRVVYKKQGWNADASLYAQTGKVGLDNLLAWYGALNVNYKTAKGWMPGIGFEYLSGKAGNDGSKDIKSFTPWFGTNHKFNGFMDYFYVGNHANTVGLTDIYAHLAYETPRFKARLTPHVFATAAALYKNGHKMSSYLGTELDLTLGYQVSDFVWLNGGYSQMLATSSMEALKGGSKDVSNNWMYVGLQVSPKLFSFNTTASKEKP